MPKFRIVRFFNKEKIFPLTLIDEATGLEREAIAFPNAWTPEELAVDNVVEGELAPNKFPDRPEILNKPRPMFQKGGGGKFDKGPKEMTDQQIRASALNATASMFEVLRDFTPEGDDPMELFKEIVMQNCQFIKTGRWE